MSGKEDSGKEDSGSIPTIQELVARMMSCDSYSELFPETFKLIQIIVCLPESTATV